MIKENKRKSGGAFMSEALTEEKKPEESTAESTEQSTPEFAEKHIEASVEKSAEKNIKKSVEKPDKEPAAVDVYKRQVLTDMSSVPLRNLYNLPYIFITESFSH